MRKSELKRSAPMARGTGFSRPAPLPRTAKPAKGPRQKSCKTCKEKFTPRTPLQFACGVPCAVEYGRKATAVQRLKQEKADRAETKAKLAKFKKRPAFIADAQQAFNEFVRFRDRDLPCICCGSFKASGESALHGGGWDCGHYISRGHASHLRFDERNAHKQRKGCNRPGATTRAKYRAGLVLRIGEAAVAELEALEYTPPTRDMTKDELVAVRDLYRAKLAALKKAA